jgi:hypothetical protein
MKDSSPFYYTELGKSFQLSTQSLTLERWEYNPNQDIMEVDLKVDLIPNEVTDSLEFTAKEKKNPNQSLHVKVGLQTENNYILIIPHVPKDYQAISLKIKETGSDKDPINLYTDYRKVKLNLQLREKTKTDYALDQIENDIQDHQNEIKSFVQQQSTSERIILKLNQEVYQISSDKKYETMKEQMTSDNTIKQKQEDIQQQKDLIAGLKDQQQEAEEEIQKLQLKYDDTKKRMENKPKK